MRRYLLTTPAKRDLTEINLYIMEQSSPAISRAVIAKILATIKNIGANPDIGHQREDLTNRPLKFLTVYQYQVVYDPTTRPVQIIRILHGNRNLPNLL